MNKLTALIEAAKRQQKPSLSTILELCALLEKAEEALEELNEMIPVGANINALATIKQWKEQT